VCSLPNTYSALCILKLTGDLDLSGVHKQQLVEKITKDSLPSLFNANYSPQGGHGEDDVRITYCFLAILRLLGNHPRYWHAVDRPAIVNNLLGLLTYQGGFAWQHASESHAGLTYCATASLKILADSQGQTLHQILGPRRFEELVRFCVMRCQENGFQGRINKPTDSCYTFWNFATLSILG